jgi:hypothetical protein
VALVGNGQALGRNPCRLLAAPLAYNVARETWNRPGSQRNLWAGDAQIDEKNAIPSGYSHPGAWVLAPKAGGASSRFEIRGTSDLAGAGAGGYAATADLSGSGSLSALDTALAVAVSALTGESSLTAAPGASVAASAALSGVGTLSATASAVVLALADLAGSGTLSALATALTSASASLSGVGALAGAGAGGVSRPAAMSGSGSMAPTSSAIASAEAALTVGAEVDPLSPTALAAAVWNAFVSEFQVSGSTGAALSEIYKILGLDPAAPLVVTSTTREAGAGIEQTIVEAPAGTVTVTRQ